MEKKKPFRDVLFWIRLIGGVLLVTFGLVLTFNVEKDGQPGFAQKIVVGVCGSIILIYAIYRAIGLIKTLENKLSKILAIVEIVLNLAVGIMMLVGGFRFSEESNSFSNFMVKYFKYFLGGVLYVRGIIYAITSIFVKEPTTVKMFVANMACLTIGVVLAARENFTAKYLAILFIVLAFACGAFLIGEGGVDYYKYRKQVKATQVENKDEVKKKENIDEADDIVDEVEIVNIPSQDEVGESDSVN